MASFAMTQFQMLLQKVEADHPQTSGESGDDATAKTAQAIAGRPLPNKTKKVAGEAVHYIYGGLLGAAYGALAIQAPVVTAGRGTLFGAAAWLGGDEIAVPAFGLSKPPSEVPASKHLSALAAHLVYGAITDGFVRLLRMI